MPTTLLHDTFAGTAAASLAGHAPDTPYAARAWTAVAGASVPVPVFAAGGGITCGTGSAGSAYGSYDLSGAPATQTITATFRSSDPAQTVSIQCRRSGSGSTLCNLALVIGYGTGFIGLARTINNGSATFPGSGSGSFATGTTYTLTLDLVSSGGSTSCTASVDGVPVTGIVGVTISDAQLQAPGLLLLGMDGGAEGAGVYTGVTGLTVTTPAATAFTLTGPSTGTVGTASGNFTFTPTGGAFAGTITPSMAGLAGTWSPTSLTWSAASNAQTATFTASAAGTGQANGTGSPALTQPSNVAFTASSAAATAFTLTGPGAGFVTNASGNFTVAPDGVYTGTITITPSGGGLSSPIVKTFTASSAPQAFAITPSSVGTVTLTPSNNGSLTNPSALGYSSNPRTLAVSPSTVAASGAGTLTFTGGGTRWNAAAPTFGPTGVAGFTLGSITVVNDTSATAPYTTGTTIGTETFTDPATSATATVVVAAVATTGQLEVYHPTPSLATVYFTLTRAGGRWWNGSAYEAADGSHWAGYAIAGSDAAGVGVYLASVPPGLPTGFLTARAYAKAGGSPAPTDTLIGDAYYYWDGTSLAYLQNPLPVNSLPLAAFAADTRIDGTCRAGSTSTLVNLSASDGIAAALAAGGGALTNVSLVIRQGTGIGSSVPVAAVTGSSPVLVGHVAAGSSAPTLDTSSGYTWEFDAAGGGAGGTVTAEVAGDRGTVTDTPRPATTTTFYAVADGLPGATGAYDRMAIRFTTPGKAKNRRGITSQTFSGGVHYFILAGPPLPTPPSAGDTFQIE